MIVNDNRDRAKWLELLDRVALRYGWRFFAWVLMDNHFHLFLRTPNPDLSAGMHDLNSGYASWFNRRHERVGSLYQGRFKAILVENESYAWTLSRYIHLNPCRAKLVKRPEDHAYSSYRYFLRSRGAPEWLDWRTVLDEMGKNRPRSRIAYRQFVEQGLQQEIESPLDQVVARVLLGSQDWVEHIRQKLDIEETDPNLPQLGWLACRPSLEQIESAVAADFQVPPESLFAKRVRGNSARAAALCLIRRLTTTSVVQLADRYGGVSQPAISKTIQRAEEKMNDQPAWRRRLARLEKKVRSSGDP